jgi:hypothetical protein
MGANLGIPIVKVIFGLCNKFETTSKSQYLRVTLHDCVSKFWGFVENVFHVLHDDEQQHVYVIVVICSVIQYATTVQMKHILITLVAKLVSVIESQHANSVG